MSKSIGLCKLTLSEGPFVDSHIIPKALTKAAKSGDAFSEGTKGRGYKRRFSSWYDKQLVTRVGEDILASIDSKGIIALRKNMLIWDTWHFFRPNYRVLSANLPNHSLRRFSPFAPKDIHKLFVSIAWRACASSLVEMHEATTSPEVLEGLRQAVLESEPLRATMFPTTLVQLTTIGPRHNQTPFREKVFNPLRSDRSEFWEVIRIYCDGLIAHVHLNGDGHYASDNEIFLGGAEKLVVCGVDFDVSFQKENLTINAWEAHAPFGKFREG